ncbi:MAG: right-handed parallel beta-helix repeat-containing protein [Fimbriimonas sp.]|nr:right-handed parallel beta-helix repeat-containing protein [Fimbriimonas sp.]
MIKSLIYAVLLGISWQSVLAANYYVSPTGKDANPGTLFSPWKTIQHACDKVPSGGAVLVASGVYKEAVTVKRSMTLTNAVGAKPVIDGTGVAVPSDNAALVLVNGISHVTIQGFEIRNYKTTDSTLLPIGILVEGAANGITIRGNQIHDIENDGSDAKNINAFGFVAYGNSSKGAITSLVIDRNTIYSTKTGNSETMTVNGNVNGFRITNNLVHDVDNIGIDCIGFEGTSPIAGQDQARNGYVALNTVYNVSSLHNPAYFGSDAADGIYVDGGTEIVIERNTIHNADLGMEVTSEHAGKVASGVIVRSNLIYACTITGLSIGGYDSKRGGTTSCTFVNNTFYGNDTTNSGSGEFMVQFYTKGNVFENNILYATSQGVLVSTAPGSGIPGVTADYNLFFTAVAGNENWLWGTKSYSTLTSFQQGSHQDSHSSLVDPSFVSAPSFNFRLNAHSPAINAGTNLSTGIVGTQDLSGNPRVNGKSIDMGCYESATSGP